MQEDGAMGFGTVKAVNGKISGYISTLYSNRFLLASLVKREFKGKFRNTALGYLWHLINPLSQIVIYYLVFSNVFGNGIENYWVYITTGMFMYTFFVSSLNLSSMSIVGNSGMVAKMAFPREILVFSCVISNLITLVISYSLLFLLMFIMGIKITKYAMLIPLLVLLAVIFVIGAGMLVGSINVYIHDVAGAVSILCTCLLFATPIMYTVDQISSPIMNFIWTINPLYYFIDCIHSVFYEGCMLNYGYLLICAVVSLVIIVVGLYIFKKLEHGFVERL